MAAGLLHEPEILFLDEPTSGIDPLARRAFWRAITALAQSGVTIVITTHFMEEAEYCDRIAIQDAGRMLALGTPRAVRPGRRRGRGRHEQRLHRHRRTGPRPRRRRPGMSGSGFLRRFLALLRKEVRQMLRDKSNMAVGLLLPAALILLFGYGLSFDVNAPLAVVMEDASPGAREAVQGLWGTAYLAPSWSANMPEAEARLRAGEVDAIVRVPPDFRALAAGRAARACNWC